MTDAIQKLLTDQTAELLGANVSGIAEELKTAPEAKLSVSMGFKLTLAGSRVYVQSGVSYSRKFADETEGIVELPDPNQPGLPLASEDESEAGESRELIEAAKSASRKGRKGI